MTICRAPDGVTSGADMVWIDPPIRVSFPDHPETADFVIAEAIDGEHAGDWLIKLEGGEFMWISGEIDAELIKGNN